MDCQHVIEHHVADRYVLNQLSAEEAERFEDHYMSCDACLEELERAEIMARGFKRAGAEQMLAAGVSAAGVAWWRRRRTWIGAAVAALAGLSVPLWFARAPGGGSDGTRANVAIVYLQPERSTEAAPSRRFRRPAEPGPVVLALELDPPFYPSYRAVVERGGQRLLEIGGLELGERDTVTLSLDSSLLIPGDHVLRLEASAPDGRPVAVGRFDFRVSDR